jgi:exopolyphosphatase/guanosine-5'-triphosphate,3'-diphosphate pyrophosphatase
VLRVGESPNQGQIDSVIRQAIKGTRLASAGAGHGLYLVGGSFRALALLDLKSTNHPLPIIHQHRVRPEGIAAVKQLLAEAPPEDIKRKYGLSLARIAALPAACVILESLMEVFKPRRILASAFGLREGLLYRELDQATRAEDPLLAGALEIGERLGRFGDHGAALDQWIAPLFPDDEQDAQRLRRAACLLGDIAWNAHPDFRAERAVDMAIHGNWVGIDARGRAMVGRTLCAAFGGDGGIATGVLGLLDPSKEKRAVSWGRAIRLAQRLSAGTEPVLRRTSISLRGKKLVLTIGRRHRELYAEAVDRRLTQLGATMGHDVEVAFS